MIKKSDIFFYVMGIVLAVTGRFMIEIACKGYIQFGMIHEVKALFCWAILQVVVTVAYGILLTKKNKQ